MTTFNVDTFDVAEYDRILACGLGYGLGERGKQICIEAAICQVLGLPHGDDPGCVIDNLRKFKIKLNANNNWSSPEARAKGLHDLGLAQLGSLGVVDENVFVQKLAEKIIRVLIPRLFLQLFQSNTELLAAAKRCEDEGTAAAAYAAADASNAAFAAYASNAAYAAADSAAAAYAVADSAAAYASADSAAYASNAAAYAAADASNAAFAAYASEEYLILAAQLAVEVLKEMNSPGCKLLKN